MNASVPNKARQDSDYVPLAFQAQIPERGKIQYAGNPEPVQKWLNEWLDGCPPVPEPEDSNIPAWQRRAVRQTAGTRLPEFSKTVKTWEYTISWRMVTNGGQDDGVIRPVIGARGLPYFPGSSMKGSFRHACPPELVLELCGNEITTEDGTKTTQPGILRFHGGYPTSMSWGNLSRLVDVVHSQQNYQVMDSNADKSAHVLVSLYQPTFKFGISSSVIPPDDPRWEEIKKIWEKALSYGLGSRVSAGYGYVNGVGSSDLAILSVSLKGRGLTSKLLNGKPEFRPNMFKATLRGNTLRILAGLIADETTVNRLCAQIWGDTKSYQENNPHPTVGLVGVRFSLKKNQIQEDTFKYKVWSAKRNKYVTVEMPTYEIESSKLEIVCTGSREISPELSEFIRYILRFSLLIGGFGKSCRRSDHHKFNHAYLNGNKPMIGCYWELLESSNNLAVTVGSDDLANIPNFFRYLRAKAIAWIETQNITINPDAYIDQWREVWHQNKVQVWGRIAKDHNDSKAVYWYHETNRLKNTSLGGEQVGNGVRKISRSYHRMYPRIQKTASGKFIRKQSEYIEILTLFPDQSDGTQNFLQFIEQQQNDGWIRLW